MPGELILRLQCRGQGIPVWAGGLMDQPYALSDAFVILDAVQAEFRADRRRVEGS